ncbi:tetratricopeptide repeat protein [Tautonia plasticadhaerens]|uniref:Tetratricopeptide repeat protein n=1 Tax=Tautonia plasticadhaerens TaxID=2527974 RepID=A0A518H1U8_9BACT|nr:tetratricopeptide repeat protein [Tautonia plasticadhaerens]QDV34821.1 Tetratricopeptide repeat protein [Tautonia plasticadhaerens]
MVAPETRPTPQPDSKAPPTLARWAGAALLGGLLILVAVAAWRHVRERGRPSSVRSRAEVALRSGRIAEAEAAMGRLAELRAPTAEDWVLRAEIALADDRPEESIAALCRIPDGHPMAPEARKLAGQIELREGRVRRAEEYLREAIELDPNRFQARRELVYIYGMQLRREEIDEQFRALEPHVPLSSKDAFLWGLSRSTAWEGSELSETLRKFIAADPQDHKSRLALSDTLAGLGRLDEAEEALDPLPADSPEVRERRAALAIERGDIPEAERLLADAPEDHAGMARLRGTLALRRRDAEAALRHFRAAEALEPDHRETIFGLARAYTLAGDLERARPYQEMARTYEDFSTLLQFAATPDGQADPELPLKLGRAAEELGRLAEARTWYRLRLERDPFDREAQQALYRLESADEPDPPRHDG